jgi:hypothetical protein
MEGIPRALDLDLDPGVTGGGERTATIFDALPAFALAPATDAFEGGESTGFQTITGMGDPRLAGEDACLCSWLCCWCWCWIDF